MGSLITTARLPESRATTQSATANLHTRIMDFRGFYSSIILILSCGIPGPIREFQGKFESSNLSRDKLSAEIDCRTFVVDASLPEQHVRPELSRRQAPSPFERENERTAHVKRSRRGSVGPSQHHTTRRNVGQSTPMVRA